MTLCSPLTRKSKGSDIETNNSLNSLKLCTL
jgi:hypothetical protein